MSASADPIQAYDAVVLGGGPAGSAAALTLARRGLNVALVDRRDFPRPKVCGDALLPGALRALGRLGLLDRVLAAGHRAQSLAAYGPAGLIAETAGEFVTLRRESLDALLHHAAVEAGARALTAEATALAGEAGGVRLDLRAAPPLRARACVLATGADTRLLARLAPRRMPPPTAVASRRYVRSRHDIPGLITHYDHAQGPAYAWIFPLGGGLYNVGVGSLMGRRGLPHRALFDRFVSLFPQAEALLKAGSFDGPLRSGMLRCGLDPMALNPLPRCLAAGEAASTTLPFTGEGVGKALETGLSAAEAVAALLAGDEAAPQGYAESVLRQAPLYRAYGAAQGAMAHPWQMDFAAWRLRHSPRLRAGLARVLNQGHSPAAVFSPAALLGSLFRP